ncbi:MAG: protein-tyrosine-phosphatase [Flavobacteriales bacterium]|nr:protein-tyrosine-phosphatase [Flavobacteriales bacterium]
MMPFSIADIQINSVGEQRKNVLQPIIDYIQSKKNEDSEINLNFICTHNSRRSQFAQVWATVAASIYNIDANCFSGGVEITACNERTIASLKRFGFDNTLIDNQNPHYTLSSDFILKPIVLFSKLVDDELNPTTNFAAIMTCSHADENCPFIAGADERIPILYNDPKKFDNTNKEKQKYDERSMQMAAEMFYVFSKIK